MEMLYAHHQDQSTCKERDTERRFWHTPALSPSRTHCLSLPPLLLPGTTCMLALMAALLLSPRLICVRCSGLLWMETAESLCQGESCDGTLDEGGGGRQGARRAKAGGEGERALTQARLVACLPAADARRGSR